MDVYRYVAFYDSMYKHSQHILLETHIAKHG